MKPSMFLLCVLVLANAAAAELSAEDTSSRRVREVRFTGDPGFAPEALRNVLKALANGYTESAVDADLARLRSFYLANGYFDVRVAAGQVTFDGREASLTVDVRSGPKHAVRRIGMDGMSDIKGEITAANGEFPVDALCKCLLAARRAAESDGRIDFAATLEVSDADPRTPADAGNWVNIAARVRMGSAHAVGRIDFSGHRRISETTLRRAIGLHERSVFDLDSLRQNLARLNRAGLIEPITLHDISIRRSSDTATVDLTIAIRERPGGRWWVTGPLGLTRAPLQAAVSSRLPAWGRGVLEASTYYATFNLIGIWNPLVALLPMLPKSGPRALLVLERPYVPGQSLFSGFALSPQLSARGMVGNYALTHLDRTVQSALVGQPTDSPGLVVPISRVRSSTDAGGSEEPSALICNPPTPAHRWLRRGAAYAAELALGAFRPF